MLPYSLHLATPRGLPLLATFVGACATLAQWAMTPAYRKGNPLLASNLSYLTVVLASLFGILLWHEHLAPRSWTGVVLLVLSGMLSAQHVRREYKPQNFDNLSQAPTL